MFKQGGKRLLAGSFATENIVYNAISSAFSGSCSKPDLLKMFD
jgi:hypothetical protein